MVYNILRFILENGFKKQKRFIKDILITEDLHERKMLDLGCGTGTYANLFDQHDYIGLDINPVYIGYARRYKNGDFVLGDACRLPFKSGTFGLVCAIAVFHHLSEAQILDILKEVERVMVPCGLFLLMDQVATRMNFLIDWFFRLIRYFDKGKFIRTPEENLNMLTKILTKESAFDVVHNWDFRNAMITNQGMLLRRK